MTTPFVTETLSKVSAAGTIKTGNRGEVRCSAEPSLSERRTVQAARGVRDSKDDGTGPVLAFNEREWLAFLDGARDGEFDLTELTASP